MIRRHRNHRPVEIALLLFATILFFQSCVPTRPHHQLLWNAAGNGNTHEVHRLLADGASIKDSERNGYSPLIAAAGGGHVEMVRFLLSRGADPVVLSCSPGYCNSALAHAASGGHAEIVILLLEAGALVNGYPVSARSIEEASALREAIRYNRVAVVQILVDAGADVENRRGSYDTPLMEAAVGGNAEIVRILLRAGADVNAEHYLDRSALDRAAAGHYLDVARILVDAGATPDEDTLLIGMGLGDADPDRSAMVRYLLEIGVDPNQTDERGIAPLHLTAFRGALELTEILLSWKADVNIQNEEGKTPLMFSAQGGFVDVIRTLLKAGADRSLKDVKGRTALDFARAGDHVDASRLLSGE